MVQLGTVNDPYGSYSNAAYYDTNAEPVSPVVTTNSQQSKQLITSYQDYKTQQQQPNYSNVPPPPPPKPIVYGQRLQPQGEAKAIALTEKVSISANDPDQLNPPPVNYLSEQTSNEIGSFFGESKRKGVESVYLETEGGSKKYFPTTKYGYESFLSTANEEAGKSIKSKTPYSFNYGYEEFAKTNRITNSGEAVENISKFVTGAIGAGATAIAISTNGKLINIPIKDFSTTQFAVIHGITGANQNKLAEAKLKAIFPESDQGKQIGYSINEFSDFKLPKSPTNGLDVGFTTISIDAGAGLGRAIEKFNVNVAPITNIVKSVGNLIAGKEVYKERPEALTTFTTPLTETAKAFYTESSIRPSGYVGQVFETEYSKTAKAVSTPEGIVDVIGQIPAYYATFLLAPTKAIEYGSKGITVAKYALKPDANPINIIAKDISLARKGYEIKPAEEIFSSKDYSVSGNPNDVVNKALNISRKEPEPVQYLGTTAGDGGQLENAVQVDKSLQSLLGNRGLVKINQSDVRITKVGENVYNIEGLGINKPVFATIGKGNEVTYLVRDIAPKNAAEIINPTNYGLVAKDIGSVAQKRLGLTAINAENTEYEALWTPLTRSNFQKLSGGGEEALIEPAYIERTFSGTELRGNSQRFFEYLSNPKDILIPELSGGSLKIPKGIGALIPKSEKLVYFAKSRTLPNMLETEYNTQSKLGGLGIKNTRTLGIKERFKGALETDLIPTIGSKNEGELSSLYSEKSYVKLVTKGTTPQSRIAGYAPTKFFAAKGNPERANTNLYLKNLFKAYREPRPKTPNTIPEKNITPKEALKLKPSERAYKNISTYGSEATKFSGIQTRQAQQETIQIYRNEVKASSERSRLREERQAKKEADELAKITQTSIPKARNQNVAIPFTNNRSEERTNYLGQGRIQEYTLSQRSKKYNPEYEYSSVSYPEEKLVRDVTIGKLIGGTRSKISNEIDYSQITIPIEGIKIRGGTKQRDLFSGLGLIQSSRSLLNSREKIDVIPKIGQREIFRLSSFEKVGQDIFQISGQDTGLKTGTKQDLTQLYSTKELVTYPPEGGNQRGIPKFPFFSFYGEGGGGGFGGEGRKNSYKKFIVFDIALTPFGKTETLLGSFKISDNPNLDFRRVKENRRNPSEFDFSEFFGAI